MKRKYLSAWFALVLTAAATAASAETYDALSIDVEPWGFAKTQSGIMPEFFRFLATQTGLDLKIGVQSTTRVLAGLGSGDTALVFVVPTPDRDLVGLPLCEPAIARTTIAYRKADTRGQAEIDWLQDQTVADLRGGHTLDGLAGIVYHRNAIVDTEAEGLAKVANRQIDGTVCVHPGCTAAMKAAKLDPALFGEIAFSATPMAIYVSRFSPLVQDLPALDKLRKACQSPAGTKLMSDLLARWD